MSDDNVKFGKWICSIQLGKYSNNRLAIKLVNAVNDVANDLYLGEPIATATTNVADIDIDNNQIIIKSDSENVGMVEALQKAGYISEKVQVVNLGFVNVHIAEKTDKLKNLENISFTPKKLKM